MERLMKSGLFGAGLVSVDTPILVGRYNQALQELGIQPTKLEKFNIDGMGWSPEIAREFQNHDYLTLGAGNQLGVIMSPDQERKPIYMSFNSFDRKLMGEYFVKFMPEIADITATHPITIDIDQEITQYKSPIDLLLVSYVIVRSSAGTLTESARAQRELVDQFSTRDNGWFDSSLRERIIESSRAHGDLRFRRVVIPEMRFSDFRSFYTRAFGGVFVFRGFVEQPLIVVEDKQVIPLRGSRQYPRNRYCVTSVLDQKLPEILMDCGVTEIDLRWYDANLERLTELKEFMALEVLCQQEPTFDYTKLTPVQKRQRILTFEREMPASYFELERLKKHLQEGSKISINDLSSDAKLMLMRPKEDAPEWRKNDIWHLLCILRPIDPLRMYTCDKNRFFAEYTAWPESKKIWVTDLLQKRYVPHAKRA